MVSFYFRTRSGGSEIKQLTTDWMKDVWVYLLLQAHENFRALVTPNAKFRSLRHETWSYRLNMESLSSFLLCEANKLTN